LRVNREGYEDQSTRRDQQFMHHHPIASTKVEPPFKKPLRSSRERSQNAPLLLFRFRQFLYRNPILIGPTNIRGLVLAPLSRPVFRMIEI
jgi:hypothetical protein